MWGRLVGAFVDVGAIAGVGGDAAGGGVGGGDKAKIFEGGHFGADGGGRNVEKLGEHDATDRGGNLGVLFDEGEEDGALTVGHG